MTEPTLVDRVYQRVFRLGYRAIRPWWALTHPRTRGAFVGVWCRGEVLIVQNGYVDYRSFPGGGVRRGELPEVAAARECIEEVGIDVRPQALSLDFVIEHEWEGKQDTVWVFALELDARPPLRIDHREVIAARFMAPEFALDGPLFPPVRRHVEARLARFGAP